MTSKKICVNNFSSANSHLTKKSVAWLAVWYFSGYNLYNHLHCCPDFLYFSQPIFMINCLKMYIKQNKFKRRVGITSGFILNVDESSWCHGWYVTWFFRCIIFSFNVAQKIHVRLLKLLISSMNWFILLYRSASSIIIDNKPQRYFLNFYFSMKWLVRNVFLVSAMIFSMNNP